MMIKKFSLLAGLVALTLPQAASAYLNPEDVLLNRELFLPPEAREAKERTLLQASESAARREREQQRAFELQHPVVVEEEPEPEVLQAAAPAFPQGGYFVVPSAPGGTMFGASPWGAPQGGGLNDTANLELLRTMRLLSRVNQNQAAAELSKVLHSGAPDLAPTGAGGVMALGTMLGAVAYTMRRAKKSEKDVQSI